MPRNSSYSGSGGGGSRSSYSSRSGGGGSRSGGGAFTYQVNMANGRKYIGMTTQPVKRTVAHLSGNGASATKNQKITSINNFKSHPSVLAAKKAETTLYYKAKAAHGASNVRGAGHTVAFSDRGNRLGNAENKLGKLLEVIRSELQAAGEAAKEAAKKAAVELGGE